MCGILKVLCLDFVQDVGDCVITVGVVVVVVVVAVAVNEVFLRLRLSNLSSEPPDKTKFVDEIAKTNKGFFFFFFFYSQKKNKKERKEEVRKKAKPGIEKRRKKCSTKTARVKTF